MGSVPRRRSSKEEAPRFSEHRVKLLKAASSFLQRFGEKEPKMTRIVEEITAIYSSVTKTERNTDGVGKVCALAAGIGLGLSVVAFPFAGINSNVPVEAESEAYVEDFAAPKTAPVSRPAAVGGASAFIAAVGGLVAAVVFGVGFMIAHLIKVRKERELAGEVKELGQEFMEIIGSMKEILEDIRSSCEELEEESPADQAGKALTDVEELQRILQRVSELKGRSVTESDRKLRDAILQSANQSQRLVVQFWEMKEELRKFTGG